MERKIHVLPLWLLFWLCWGPFSPAQGGKVLVIPVDGSHWLSMKVLVEELKHRGHEMVVLVPEANMLLSGPGNYEMQTFPVPYSRAELDSKMDEHTRDAFLSPPTFTELRTAIERLTNITNLMVKGCEGLLYNETIMGSLRDRGFDLLLTDPFLPCGSIIADAFSLPAVYFLRGIPCGLDMEAAQCPTPPSFVPRIFTGYTDVMNFPQRLKNVFVSGVQAYFCTKLFASFNELSGRYLQKEVTYKDLLSNAAIWLMRYDFTFEYPRPIMPNMVQIGGINCAKKNSLPVVSPSKALSCKYSFL